ncbi:MAG TPA: pitrilysin family protein [Gemmataceae bacterium]|jgi:zinc protease|nr:pitrilysin family protein [Gemmataceae bacterium]
MRKASALFVVLFCAAALRADEAPRKIATVEGVTEYQLANGARVLLYPELSRPTITINMTVLTGSRHEGYGETGMAHLLEHMVFKGTPTFRDVPKALRDHGANFNGTTNVDRTNYFETMPATDENLDFGVHLEADRLVNSFVKREDLASEMTVVRNEFERGENSPQGVLMQRIEAAAYEWHNYGKSTIGNRSDIERVPIENLQAFYRKYYQPDNVVLIIAGKFDEAKALAVVQKHLGAIPRPKRKLDDTYTEEPPQDGERTVILRRVGKVGSVGVAYHVPSAAHPDWAPLNLLAGIVSQQPNGRLYKALVEAKKATSAAAFAGNNHDPGLFIGSAEAEPGRLDAVRDTLLATLENMTATPFQKEEVDRAKTRSKRAEEMRAGNSTAMAQALSSASSLGDWRLLFVQRDRLAAVTAADVNRVAQTYFKRQNRTVGIYIPVEQPERLLITAAPPVAALVKDYKGGSVLAAGEIFDPTPENLDARTSIVDLGGIKAGLLPKKNRGETVSLVLTLHYGNEESLKGQTTAAGMLPMLMMAGTKKHDRQALREALDELGVRISPGLGGFGGRGGRRGGGGGGGGAVGQLTFSVEAKRSTLPEALKLLGEILREPAFPEAEFDNMKRFSLAMSERMQNQPDALARNKLDRALSPYGADDVRYVPTRQESAKQLKSLTLPQVITLYEKQLGASAGELAVVGDFDPEPTLLQVRAILKDWKSVVPVRRIERAAPASMTGLREEIQTPDNINAVFLAGMAFPLKDSDPDYAALRLGNFIFGGGTLSSRLGNRIRQKEGLSYGVTSQFSAAALEPAASFTVNASTNPINIDRVEKAVAEELQEFLANGPSLDELLDAQKAYLEAQKVSRTADASIAGQIVSNLHLGRSFAYAGEQEKRIAALTPEDVKSAFRKFMDPKKLVIIRAGDFKK